MDDEGSVDHNEDARPTEYMQETYSNMIPKYKKIMGEPSQPTLPNLDNLYPKYKKAIGLGEKDIEMRNVEQPQTQLEYVSSKMQDALSIAMPFAIAGVAQNS